jgi:predicted transcriptional regulator
MTLASKRRILELDIVDAARVIARRHDADPGIRNLQELIGQLDHLELEAANRALHPAKGPITSRGAAESLINVSKLASEVFTEIMSEPKGMTCDEVELLMDGRHQTISARVNELRDKGWIKDSGRKRKTRSGRQAIVWIPTEQARKQLSPRRLWEIEF